jgi:hypothetical protein
MHGLRRALVVFLGWRRICSCQNGTNATKWKDRILDLVVRVFIASSEKSILEKVEEQH